MPPLCLPLRTCPNQKIPTPENVRFYLLVLIVGRRTTVTTLKIMKVKFQRDQRTPMLVQWILGYPSAATETKSIARILVFSHHHLLLIFHPCILMVKDQLAMYHCLLNGTLLGGLSPSLTCSLLLQLLATDLAVHTEDTNNINRLTSSFWFASHHSSCSWRYPGVWKHVPCSFIL